MELALVPMLSLKFSESDKQLFDIFAECFPEAKGRKPVIVYNCAPSECSEVAFYYDKYMFTLERVSGVPGCAIVPESRLPWSPLIIFRAPYDPDLEID